MISRFAIPGSRAAVRCAAIFWLPVVWTAACGSSTPTSGPGDAAGVVGQGTGGNTGGSAGGTAPAGSGGSSGGGGSYGVAGSPDAGSAQGGMAGQVSAPDAGAFCLSEPAPSCAQSGCTAPPSCASTGPGRNDCGANKESCCASLEGGDPILT